MNFKNPLYLKLKSQHLMSVGLKLAFLSLAGFGLLRAPYVLAEEPNPTKLETLNEEALKPQKTKLSEKSMKAEAKKNLPKNLSELLQKIQTDNKEQSLQLRQRELEFLKRRNKQKALLNQALKELKAQEERSIQLQRVFEARDKDLSALEERLSLATGALGELFGAVRQTARESSALLEDSIISAQYPGRAEELKKIAAQKRLPNTKDLEKLWMFFLQEMIEQGRISKFKARLFLPDGRFEPREIIRAGSFNLFSQGRYLSYDGKTGRTLKPRRQPERSFLSLARKLEKPGQREILKLGLDPSRGNLLFLLAEQPQLSERIAQGGIIGYIILALLLLGLGIALLKYLKLYKEGQSLKAQMQSKDILPGNALGEIMQIFKDFNGQNPEGIELKAEELILKKTAELKQGLNLIRLLAGVAPLLGLLGTVTGMIITFQSITLFGTGDPKLMAGGISQALVTTALGLISAIPLIFAYSFVSGAAKALSQVYEEQAIGLSAKRHEA